MVTPPLLLLEVQMTNRKDFLLKVKVGSIIAFRQGDELFSGKVIELRPDKHQFVVRTKSCSIFFVEYKDFIWLKTGSHWPIGIFNALKYRKLT